MTVLLREIMVVTPCGPIHGGADPDETERIECCRYGTPATCAEELCRFVEAGAGTLILRLASENQLEQLSLCTERLLPPLKSANVPSAV